MTGKKTASRGRTARGEPHTPERVRDKLRECRFFLSKAARYDDAPGAEKFLYYLSAFLSAFRTAIYRLTGTVGCPRKKAELREHPTIGFVWTRADVETHEGSTRVLKRYIESDYDSKTPRFGGRFIRKARHHSRFKTPSKTRVREGWRFEESSDNLMAVCDNAINALEEQVRKTTLILES